MCPRSLLVACLIGVSAATVAGPAPVASIDDSLVAAEAARSQGAKRFQPLVAQLRLRIEAQGSGASDLQRERLRYLEAYDLGVYRNDRASATMLAEQVAEATGDIDLKYRTHALAANLAGNDRVFATALRNLDSALQLRDQVTDRETRHLGLMVSAVLYTQLGQYESAIRFTSEILTDAPSTRTSCLAGGIRIEAIVRSDAGVTDSDAKQAIDYCDSLHEPIATNLIRSFLAQHWAQQGRGQDAITLLDGALPEVESTGYPLLTAEFHSVLGKLKLDAKDLNAAKAHAEAAVAARAESISLEPVVRAYETLYRVAQAQGRSAEALDHYIHYADARLKHEQDVKTRELAYAMYSYETREQKQQIELLERKNQLLGLQRAVEKSNAQRAELAAVLLVLILGGIVFWAVQLKRHHVALRRLAQTDPLTGVGNRHYFTEQSSKALAEAAHAGEQMALIMFDLDHFKAINDSYGHSAGDWVLREVGRICAEHCRGVGMLSRIGGEEFAVLLRGYDTAAVGRLAEACRAELACIDTRESGHRFVVTASFGVATSAHSGYTLSRLLSHADQMLYQAKHEGRNRVCVHLSDEGEGASGERQPPLLTVVGKG